MNPILSVMREYDTGQDTVMEFLFQCCRLWDEHRPGTCPVDYSDPGGVAPFDIALVVGEDSAYWDCVLALWSDQGFASDPLETRTERVLNLWHQGVTPPGYNTKQAFGTIRVATLTLDRWLRVYGREV